MATDSLVIHLPETLHRRLERLAALTRRPLENLIVQTLSASLPPLPEDLAPAMRDALAALEQLSDADLAQLAHATFPHDDYDLLTSLREKRRAGDPLSEQEQSELERLTETADLLTLKKAYAAVLLKWRGQALPTLSESGI